ncbi:hypothetical protein [Actinocatenispora rupis]|uniref:Uncharacterized protein n=1 Tax=Actinocatenispora rupis TaxID=519421 RepID=A0A8J3JF88_9ACTN|nr:hypothetical protein [Actinocatenispora rupis]GID13788.1 hypothetical protein Aru02nite_46770 [Actinocatenispora rupis]
MSLGGILPLDNLGDATHASVAVDGPVQGAGGLDLAGVSGGAVHAGPLTVGGGASLADPGASVGVSGVHGLVPDSVGGNTGLTLG